MIHHFTVERSCHSLSGNGSNHSLVDLNDWIARSTVLVTNSFSLTSRTFFSQDQAIFLCNELYLLASGLEIKRSKAPSKSSFSIWSHDVFCYITDPSFPRLYKGGMQKWIELQNNFIYGERKLQSIVNCSRDSFLANGLSIFFTKHFFLVDSLLVSSRLTSNWKGSRCNKDMLWNQYQPTKVDFSNSIYDQYTCKIWRKWVQKRTCKRDPWSWLIKSKQEFTHKIQNISDLKYPVISLIII